MSFNTAEALFAVGNIAGAERELHSILADQPEDAQAQCLLVRCHLARGEKTQARYIAERVVGQDPEVIDGWTLLGMIEAGNGLFVRAEEAYSRALDLDPEDDFTHLCLAQLYAAYDQDKQARMHFDRALTLDPDDPYALCAFAKFLHSRGEDYGALIDRALQVAPDNAAVILLMGDLALHKGDVKEARDRALWVLEQDADNDDALILLCKVRGQQNFLIGAFMRLQITLSQVSLTRKILVASALLMGVILLHLLIMAFLPEWLHHAFVIVAVIVGAGLVAGDTIMELLIEHERREMRLKDGF